MDLKAKPDYFGALHSISSHEVLPLESNTRLFKKKPFEDTPLCNLNLKETSPKGNNNNQNRGLNIEVSSAQRKKSNRNNLFTKNNLLQGPCTPGRPIFSFSSGNVKSFPSKWDDAEKWLNGSNSSCNDSPEAPHFHNINKAYKTKPLAEVKSRVLVNERVSKGISNSQNTLSLEHQISAIGSNGVSISLELVLKDKFTNEVEPTFSKARCFDPSTKETFFFGNLGENPIKNAGANIADVAKHRDIGTEMTPLASSTTSRCPTPFLSTSPIRPNTPASRSGPLALMGSKYNDPTIDIGQLKECHLAKLNKGSQFDSVVSAWNSREEEEEEISKSLRHFEFSYKFRKSVSDSKACKWEQEEKNKYCLRYQKEEAKIQAWVNLQSAKAETQTKKLEVKMQKMRSDLEEKLMKRMAIVHGKAEERRADAQFQHSAQIQKATKQAHKMLDRHVSYFSSQKNACACFPCNSHIYP